MRNTELGRFKLYGRGVEHNVSNSLFVYSYGSGHKIMCPYESI